MTALIVTFIKLYQRTLSPDHGWFKRSTPTCRYLPTCSAYAITSVTRYGSITGTAIALKRIIRCHPWHNGGFDPVPDGKTVTSSSLDNCHLARGRSTKSLMQGKGH